MAAVHFRPIQCESYTAHKVQGKPYFSNICVCANDSVYARCKDFRTFQTFYENCLSFRAPRILGKCTSRHLLIFPREDLE